MQWHNEIGGEDIVAKRARVVLVEQLLIEVVEGHDRVDRPSEVEVLERTFGLARVLDKQPMQVLGHVHVEEHFRVEQEHVEEANVARCELDVGVQVVLVVVELEQVEVGERAAQHRLGHCVAAVVDHDVGRFRCCRLVLSQQANNGQEHPIRRQQKRVRIRAAGKQARQRPATLATARRHVTQAVRVLATLASEQILEIHGFGLWQLVDWSLGNVLADLQRAVVEHEPIAEQVRLHQVAHETLLAKFETSHQKQNDRVQRASLLDGR